MIKTYLVIAWRTLLKHKLFSFINVFGLSLSIALGMVVLMHVREMLSYDTFHKNKHLVYRVLSNITSDGKGEWTFASTPLPLQHELVGKTGVQSVVRIYPLREIEATANGKTVPISVMSTGPAFFDVFSFELKSGSVRKSLDEADKIVLSAATAEKFFGERDAVGETITFGDLGTFQISGVLRPTPSPSHIEFDAIVSEATIPSLERDRRLPIRSNSWDSFEHAYTYVRLENSSDIPHLRSGLAEISAMINHESVGSKFELVTQSLTSITPTSDDIYNDIGGGTTWGKLLAVVGGAFVILMAACFNYANLTIARSFSKLKEVGLRKIVGAQRRQIFQQQIVESLLVAFLALFFAQIIQSCVIGLEIFEENSRLTLEMDVVVIVVVFTMFVGVLAGILPAFMLSSYRAIQLLRNVASERIIGSMTLRKMLIVFQFSISIVVLIFMSVFHRQFAYMSTVDPGFRMENIVSVTASKEDINVLKMEFERLRGVDGVSASSGNFGRYPTGIVSIRSGETGKDPINAKYYFADSEVIRVSSLTILAGQNFNVVDPLHEQEIILNERASRLLGFQDPLSAIGSILHMDSIDVRVCAVIANIYNEGVGISYGPMVLRHRSDSYNVMNVSVASGDRNSLVAAMQSVWKKVCPERSFEYTWLQEQHDSRYADMGSVTVLGFVAFMAVSIASLGLLGLVVYTVETRRREISIRKVIGASVEQLMYLLSKGFVRLLMIAGAIAIPLATLASEFFLMNFENRVRIGIVTPLVCFVGLVLLGLLMIGSQTWRASVENAAKNLKE